MEKRRREGDKEEEGGGGGIEGGTTQMLHIPRSHDLQPRLALASTPICAATARTVSLSRVTYHTLPQ